MFSWMDFGSGNFRVLRSVVLVECIMKEISAVSTQLLSMFLTSILKLYNRLSNIFYNSFHVLKYFLCETSVCTLCKAEVLSINLV
jgi:hypothetical protein